VLSSEKAAGNPSNFLYGRHYGNLATRGEWILSHIARRLGRRRARKVTGRKLFCPSALLKVGWALLEIIGKLLPSARTTRWINSVFPLRDGITESIAFMKYPMHPV
jgi:hypothetical protein